MTDEKRDPSWIRRSDGTYGPIETVEEACAALFRAAYRGLRWQGWAQALRDPRTCATRSRQPDGRMFCCAIGWAAPDAPTLNPDDPPSICDLAPPLRAWYAAASPRDIDRFDNFRDALQLVHDLDKPEPSLFRRMERFRKKHGYPIPGEPS